MPKPNDVPKPGDVWIGSLSRGDVVFAEYVVATLARPDGGGFPDRVSFVAPAGWVAVGDLLTLDTHYARSLLIHVDRPAAKVPSAVPGGPKADSFDARLVRFGLSLGPRPRLTRSQMIEVMRTGRPPIRPADSRTSSDEPDSSE